MRSILVLLAILALGHVIPALAQDHPIGNLQNIILMGWDGTHRDHVKNLLKEEKLPHLKQLIAEGTLVDIDVTSGATDTKAGWTQILTGYRPEITGVYNNRKYRDVPAGYSIFERLKTHLGTDTFAAVAVIGKKGHCGEINAPFKRPYDAKKDEDHKAEKQGKKKNTMQQPGFRQRRLGQVVEENGQKFLVFDGSPYYTMHKACDEWHFGLMQDVKVGDKALDMLEKYQGKPFFFFVHCAEVDHNGHRHGEPSIEYNDAIISGDVQLGRLVERLKVLKIYDKTRIYVTADHGFDVGKKSHHYAPYVFLATNDNKVMRDGTRADISPTILDSFGLDLSKIEPKLDGESLRTPATKPVDKAPAAKPDEIDREDAKNSLKKKIQKLVEKDKIITTVNNLFIHTDNRNWPGVIACFSDQVLLDMTSLTGGVPTQVTPKQITDQWEQGLKKLKAIHHQAGNYQIEVKNSEADVFCYGIATHYLPNPSKNNVRTFVGSYNIHLVKLNQSWRIDKLKFNLKYLDGNLELEKSAEGSNNGK